VPEMARRTGVLRQTLLRQVKRLSLTPKGESLVRRIGGRWYVDPALMQIETLTTRVEHIEADVSEMRVGMASFVKWSRSIDARLR